MSPGHKTSALCCVLGLASAAVPAAEWSAQPSFSLGADVDTNRRLTDPASTSQAARFTGSLDLARVTSMHRFTLRPRVELRRYDREHEVLDSNDFGADLKFERQGELTRFTFGATAAQDSTLTTELADTGIVEGHARRRTLSAGTDVSRSVGERTRAQAGATFVDVGFDDAGGTGLTPYRYPSAFIGLALDATDRSQVRITANGGRLEVPSTGTRIDNFAVRASWSSNLTERLSLELNGGVNRSESAQSQDQGAVFGLTSSWKAERSSLSLALAREVEPSALGRMVKADSIVGSWSWNVGERTRLAMSARHARREDLLFGLFPERREYSTLHAAVTWRVDSNWNLELRAGAVRQAYELTDFDANGERVALSVSWSPLRYAVSR